MVGIHLVIHGKIPTLDYLYVLNMGSLDPNVFCGLHRENGEHISQ